MFEAVIFDWDETLAKTRDVAVRSFKKALQELHIEVPVAFVEKQMGKSAREILREVLRNSHEDYDDAKLDRLLEKRIDAEIELCSQVTLHEGSLELFGFIERKDQTCISYNERSSGRNASPQGTSANRLF